MLKKFVLNRKGVRELLQSDAISSAVRKAGETVKTNAGEGYSLNMRTGKNRAICRVYAYSKEAINDAYENNTLLKALHE